jgi:hypothetical protein
MVHLTVSFPLPSFCLQDYVDATHLTAFFYLHKSTEGHLGGLVAVGDFARMRFVGCQDIRAVLVDSSPCLGRGDKGSRKGQGACSEFHVSTVFDNEANVAFLVLCLKTVDTENDLWSWEIWKVMIHFFWKQA